MFHVLFMFLITFQEEWARSNGQEFIGNKLHELEKTIESLQSDVRTLKEDKRYLELDIAALLEERDLTRYRMSQLEKKAKGIESSMTQYENVINRINGDFEYFDGQLQNMYGAIDNCCTLSVQNRNKVNNTQENVMALKGRQDNLSHRMDILYNNSVIMNNKLNLLVNDPVVSRFPLEEIEQSKRNTSSTKSGQRASTTYLREAMQWLHMELMSTKLKQMSLSSRLAQLENNRTITNSNLSKNLTARNSAGRASKEELNYVNNPPNEVELLAIVDYEAYQTWYSREGGDNTAGRKLRTQQAITRYITSVVHGMNSIYKTLESQDLNIKISLVDILIIQTKDGGRWMSKLAKSSFPRNIVMADKALHAFYRWIHKYQRALPPHDHAMLFTGFDLQTIHETADRLTTGHAYLGTICQDSSVSVVENQFNFEDVEAASHELGHSLGSEHDGFGNSCSSKEGFLMGPIIEVNSTYRWYFSSCSVNYIQESLELLSREERNCLLTIDNSGHMPVTPSADVQLGKLLTPDEQCALIEGPGSFFCRDFYGENDYPTLCRNMWCYNVTNSITKNKQTCNTFLGSDGFVCGDQKICVQGECVEDYTAPSVLDHCPQGDEKGVIWKNFTCADIVKEVPEQCYDSVTQKKCCASCDSIDTGDSQCPYGDRSSWCRSELDLPMGCYNNEDLCCATCAKVENTLQPECPYGDRSSWCHKSLKPPVDCYENENLCCETCSQYKNHTNSECPYGDRSTWCTTKLKAPFDCYRNSELCCGTCEKYYKPDNVGCEFGDKSLWCTEEMKGPSGCYLNSELCCGTCSHHYNASNVGCEYGDKHSECALIKLPMGCYKNQEQCCGSCRPLKNPERQGCEFGDKSLWCKTRLRPKQDCDLNMELCCGTCQYEDIQYG